VTYTDIIAFLASNPYVLAVISLLALWPLLKGLFTYGFTAWQWFFGRVSVDETEIKLGAQDASFFVSTIVWYTWIMVISFAIAIVFFSIGFGLGSVEQTTSVKSIRWLTFIMQNLAGMLVGIMFGNIGMFALAIRKKLRSKKDSEIK
jgi:hypothetical protein